MSRFEDNLWHDLAGSHGAALAEQPAPSGPGRGRYVAAGGLVAVAAAAAVTIPTVVGGSAPAYAMTEHADGSVGFVLHDIEHLDEANQALADAGIDAVVVPARQGCDDTYEPYRGATGRADLKGNAQANTWTIYPDQIPRGATQLLAAYTPANGGATGFASALAVGEAPECLPIAPRGGPGTENGAEQGTDSHQGGSDKELSTKTG